MRVPFRVFPLSLTVAAGIVCAPALLNGQVNQSDVSGLMITSGDLIGGNFAEPGTFNSFSCPVAYGVRTASDRVSRWFSGGAVPASVPNLPPRAELQTILISETAPATARQPVLESLTRGNESARDEAVALLDDLATFLAIAGTLDPRQPDPAVTRALTESISSFNRFVLSSNRGFLTAPPPEFIGLRAALFEITNTAIENGGRSADISSVDDAGIACAPVPQPVPQTTATVANFCRMSDGMLREVELHIAGADTTVFLDGAEVGRRVPLTFDGSYAADAAWYRGGEPIELNSVTYVPWGTPRRADPAAIRLVGEYGGIPLYSSPGASLEEPASLLIPVRECEVHEFRPATALRVRG